MVMGQWALRESEWVSIKKEKQWVNSATGMIKNLRIISQCTNITWHKSSLNLFPPPSLISSPCPSLSSLFHVPFPLPPSLMSLSAFFLVASRRWCWMEKRKMENWEGEGKEGGWEGEGGEERRSRSKSIPTPGPLLFILQGRRSDGIANENVCSRFCMLFFGAIGAGRGGSGWRGGRDLKMENGDFFFILSLF